MFLAATLVAVSCGSDDNGAATPTDGGTAAPAATTAAAADTTAAPADTAAAAAETTAAPADTTAAAGSAGKVTDFAAYVGGSGAADASLAPIKIGYFNQQGGAVVVSDTNVTGINAAVKYVNEEAGGIGGHPLEVETCYIANTEEEGQQCGQQFANDDSIVAIETGPTFIGTESFYAAIAGSKPVVAGVSVSAADTVQDTAAVLFGGAKYILAPYATFARDTLGTKSAALVYPEGAGQDEGAKGQASAFEAAGIPIKVVSYPADTPDLTVPLLAAGAQDVDLVMPVINPNDCVKFAEATRQLGIPDEKVLASPICINADVAAGLGGDLPKWLYAVASSLSIDPTDPSVPPYTDILKAQGLENEHRRSVGAGRLRPDDDAGEVAQRHRSGQHLERHDREGDEGVQRSADPRLARAPVRQVPGGARRLQRLHAVLQVQRRPGVGTCRRLRGSARRMGRIAVLQSFPITQPEAE